ncbi:aquaporin-like protein [Lactarius akahatsu]|uniref:Aquaporin-like protein n=1 Tax=Lactarius akahatsu TaxID=416441 RepID=A0AAD4LC00_9AGAM|nr:aquaporin-like protein [Lactarius akahatsu]
MLSRDYWPNTTFPDDLKAALFEFVGTTVFLLLAFGGTQGSNEVEGSDLERTLYIATAFGLSLLVSAWFFFRATGGLFNPDVSLALLLIGAIGPVRFILFCIAQLTGAITAAAVILSLTPGALTYNTVPSPNINLAQGVFIEMFITAALCLAVLMLAAEKHSATPFAPIGVGLTLFACHLFAVPYTGAAMNTARAFGPAVVTGFPGDAQWIYWLGPFLGALLATAFYVCLKQYVILTSLPPPSPSPFPSWGLFSPLLRKVWTLTPKIAYLLSTRVLDFQFQLLCSTATNTGPSILGKKRPSLNCRHRIL